MKALLPRILLIAAGVLLCFCKTSRAEEGVGVPSHLMCSESGLGGCHTIELRDGHFWYRFDNYLGKPGMEKMLPSPSPTEWKEFWACLEKIHLWKWAKKYEPPEGVFVDDGTQWTVAITWNGKSMKAEGDNGYPSDIDPSLPSQSMEVSRPFRDFGRGLNKLFKIK